jgi:nitroreductase
MALPPAAGWRQRIKALAPDFLQDWLRRLADAERGWTISRQTWAWNRRDMQRYLRWQHSRNRRYSREQLQSKIIKTYHGLEKGLSMAAPRDGFGKAAALTLKGQIEDYRRSFGVDRFLVAPVRVLHDYMVFQTKSGEKLPILTAFLSDITPAIDALALADRGGTEPVTAAAIKTAADVPLAAFLESRHSIRHFAGLPVSSAALATACRLAQLAPSACNRQGGRAHCFNDPALVRQVIGLQPGNRGFGDSAGAVIVVTGDIRSYAEAGERRQAQIDASLFAMTLVYALHAQGLGTCMLAWCVSPEVDDAMRAAARLDDSEEIAMLIAVGQLPENLNVPVSTRYPPHEIATLNLAPLDPAA